MKNLFFCINWIQIIVSKYPIISFSNYCLLKLFGLEKYKLELFVCYIHSIYAYHEDN